MLLTAACDACGEILEAKDVFTDADDMDYCKYHHLVNELNKVKNRRKERIRQIRASECKTIRDYDDEIARILASLSLIPTSEKKPAQHHVPKGERMVLVIKIGDGISREEEAMVLAQIDNPLREVCMISETRDLLIWRETMPNGAQYEVSEWMDTVIHMKRIEASTQQN